MYHPYQSQNGGARREGHLITMQSDLHINYALECKAWWAEKLLSGEKTVEVRQWSLYPHLLGEPVWLAATTGPEAQASLGDAVVAGQLDGKLVGWVIFSGVKEYSNADDFAADELRHRVGADSLYSWRDGITGHGETVHLYGWEVGRSEKLDEPLPLLSMQRIHRSLYQLDGS